METYQFPPRRGFFDPLNSEQDDSTSPSQILKKGSDLVGNDSKNYFGVPEGE